MITFTGMVLLEKIIEEKISFSDVEPIKKITISLENNSLFFEQNKNKNLIIFNEYLEEEDKKKIELILRVINRKKKWELQLDD